MIRYPKPLRTGSTLAVTSPSSGVEKPFHKRLDLSIQTLRDKGYKVVEGQCLRSQHKNASAPIQERFEELIKFWHDPEVDMIFPPWGGERSIELLRLIEFDKLKANPKWIQGFSDISTLLFPLTLLTDTATSHGCNLMDFGGQIKELLTANALSNLATPTGTSFVQRSSPLWQKTWTDFILEPEKGYDLSEKTQWKILGKERPACFSGRLIGGCIDTLTYLTGTRFGDLPAFSHRYKEDRIILYLENSDQDPCGMIRSLWNFRLAGWFDRASGLVLGRSPVADSKEEQRLSYKEALEEALAGIDLPVIYDTDVGHVPPQMTIINGALAEVRYENGQGTVVQKLV